MWILVIVLGLLLGALLIASLKGVVKLILLALAVIGAILTYFWVQKYGFSCLAFVTDQPREWMVTTLAILGAIFVFAAFRHGLSWFSNMFSWEGRLPGMGGKKGIITTICMSLFIFWLVLLGVFYFGSLSEIRRFRQIATDASARQQIPIMAQGKYYVETSRIGEFLSRLDPFNDKERLKLAKLVAYLASEDDEARREEFLRHLSRYLPHVNRLASLATDKGIRSAMQRNDMGALLNSTKITKILSDERMRGGLKTVDPEKLFGMVMTLA